MNGKGLSISEHEAENFKSREELVQEKTVFSILDYKYFIEHFGLPDLPRKTEEQIVQVREFLNVATLSVFKKRDMAVSFRSDTGELSEDNVIRLNKAVQWIQKNTDKNQEYNCDLYTATVQCGRTARLAAAKWLFSIL